MLLYQGIDADESTDDHEGFIAGLRVDGGLTDIWTDVRGQRAGLYSAFVPRCDCGWRGAVAPATPAGYLDSERVWHEQHLRSVLAGRAQVGPGAASPYQAVIIGGFVPEGRQPVGTLASSAG